MFGSKASASFGDVFLKCASQIQYVHETKEGKKMLLRIISIYSFTFRAIPPFSISQYLYFSYLCT